MTPDELVLNARAVAKLGKWDEADRLYKCAIRILAKKQNHSPDLKESYLSKKAEYLCNKPYFPDRESLDEFKKRNFDAIRYLNECIKISKENVDHYRGLMNKLVQRIIKQCGCTLFETDHHVIMSCPIQLRDDKFGSMGASVGLTYEKILCSICGLDILDENCTHDINQIYDGKKCSLTYKNLQIKDISLVDRPKDPLCRIIDIFYPKELFLQKQGLDNLNIDLKQKFDVRCTRCRDENIDSSSITPNILFQIHGLNISLDKPKKISAPKDLKKGEFKFGCIVATEHDNIEPVS